MGAARLVTLVIGFVAASAAAHGPPPAVEEASPLLYELPAAGSYDLPVITRVADHVLLSADGETSPVLGLEKGDCALVSFIYLSCPDACPLALSSLQRLDRALAQQALAERVRLVTVSFDPERDTPDAMANLRVHMKPRGDWRFLTAPDESSLQPVLEDYGQDIVPLVTAGGEKSGVMRHVAKVFLVDGEGGVRNVYSTGFLDHRLLLRDVETLLGPER